MTLPAPLPEITITRPPSVHRLGEQGGAVQQRVQRERVLVA